MTSTEELNKNLVLWDETIELWNSIPRIPDEKVDCADNDCTDIDWADDDWTVSFPTACDCPTGDWVVTDR